MAYTTLVAGTTITSAWANASVRDQVVSPFASAAARSSAITSPVEGMVSHLNDVNSLGVYSGAAWSTVGPVSGALTAWTPTILQPGVVTGTTINYARYQRIGRWIQGAFYLGAGGTGTISTLITIGGLPTTAASANVSVGAFETFDVSLARKDVGALYLETTTTFSFRISASGGAGENRLGVVGWTAAIASGDVFIGNFGYEASADA